MNSFKLVFMLRNICKYYNLVLGVKKKKKRR